MKRVFLYAYDRQNLGDDLFVHTITRRYPDVQFYIWSDRKNRETFSSLSNLKVIDKDSRMVHILRKLRASFVPKYRSWLEKRCEAVVYIGGSIFMEYPNWEQVCAWWEYESKNRPLYVLGANFGPWHTEAYRQKMEDVFRDCRDVCFRDRYSQGLFPNTIVVRQAPDILFSYPIPKAEVKEKQLFVSVVDCAGKTEGAQTLRGFEDRYLSGMAQMLFGYLQQGWRVILASFCQSEGDQLAADRIRKTMGIPEEDSRVGMLAYDGSNAAVLTEAIAASEYVIATRFHGVILALAAGRPVFPVIYSDKTARVLEDIRFQGEWADLRRPEPLSFESSVGNLRRQNCSMDQSVCINANVHFAKLDELLK